MIPPSLIVCCRVDDPDPACTVEPGHVIGTCANCNHKVRVGPASVAAIFTHGAQPWCIQCAVALPNAIFVRPKPR